jgi:hypothetical protein
MSSVSGGYLQRRCPGFGEVLQCCAAFAKGFAAMVLFVQVEDVEDHVGDGVFGGLPGDVGVAAGEALLEQVEVEPGTFQTTTSPSRTVPSVRTPAAAKTIWGSGR